MRCLHSLTGRRRLPHITGAKYLERWDDKPDRYHTTNDGFGVCNTGWGMENHAQITCPLGGIGCNVDHIAIARAGSAPEAADHLAPATCPACGSLVGRPHYSSCPNQPRSGT